MAGEQISLVGGSSPSRSMRVDAQRSFNMYPERAEANALAPAYLLGAPGKRRLLTFGSVGAVRGGIRVSSDKAYVVSGNTVYVVTSGFVATSIGTIYSGSLPVSMESNGATVMLVTGTGGWFITIATDTLTQITDLAFTGATLCGYIKGFFIWNKPGTQLFQISRNLSTTIDPLDFSSATGSPDLLVCGIVNSEEYWAFGENSTQVFADTGNATFPIEPVTGVFIETGCAAAYSPAKFDGGVAWLTADARGVGTVVRSVGYQAQRISTHPVETAIARIASTVGISDAIGFSYSQEGHQFYVLTFPAGQQTWAFDAASGEWCERGYLEPSTGLTSQDRAMCAFAFANKVCVGDRSNGKLYALDMDYYTEDGEPLLAFRQAAHIAAGNNRITFHELWVDMEVGVGLDGGVFGSDPQVLLRWSDDGGRTYAQGLTGKIGKIGENLVRVRWTKLGKSRQRTWRIELADPVRRVLIDARVRATVGAN